MCQKFVITDTYSSEYTIDRKNRMIYCHGSPTDTSDTIKKIDLKTRVVNKSNFQFNPPVFANNKPFLVYNTSVFFHSNNNLVLHNVLTNSDYNIADSNNISPVAASANIIFSPNDKYILLSGYVFSLMDSSLKSLKFDQNIDINFVSNDLTPQWSSDTSFVFASADSAIMEYFLTSGRIDTLVKAGAYPVSGFAYNTKYNILAYSFQTVANPSPQIYFHYKGINKDSVVFSPLRDDPNSWCWNSFIKFTSLRWSPDNGKLSFLIFHGTVSSAGIYLYSLDSNKIYKATECGDYPLKYVMEWANNDTLIYYGSSDGLISGFNTSSIITSIKEKNNSIPKNYYLSQNYPNPFNPTTKIDFSIPKLSHVTVKVYDILGKEITTLINKEMRQGSYTVDFNGNNLSSGVYIYVLKTSGFYDTKKMILLN